MDTKNTIKWYKVTCSLYKESIAIRSWNDIIKFMSSHIGFDYNIIGQTTAIMDVDCEYQDNMFYKLR